MRAGDWGWELAKQFPGKYDRLLAPADPAHPGKRRLTLPFFHALWMSYLYGSAARPTDPVNAGGFLILLNTPGVGHKIMELVGANSFISALTTPQEDRVVRLDPVLRHMLRTLASRKAVKALNLELKNLATSELAFITSTLKSALGVGHLTLSCLDEGLWQNLRVSVRPHGPGVDDPDVDFELPGKVSEIYATLYGEEGREAYLAQVKGQHADSVAAAAERSSAGGHVGCAPVDPACAL